jgi:hypothetical protein
MAGVASRGKGEYTIIEPVVKAKIGRKTWNRI